MSLRARPVVLLPRRGFLARGLAALAGVTLLGRSGRSEAETLVTEQYIGEIRLFAGNFAPRSWALCNGQLLSIAQNQALFSILGTTYGGNGATNFALPDLRGRLAIHQGQGSGLTHRTMGERAGIEAYTLSIPEMPAHTHVARASAAAGTSPDPAGRVLARSAGQIPQWGATVDTAMGPGAIANTGANQPHSNVQPYLALSFIIALQGQFPPFSEPR